MKWYSVSFDFAKAEQNPLIVLSGGATRLEEKRTEKEIPDQEFWILANSEVKEPQRLIFPVNTGSEKVAVEFELGYREKMFDTYKVIGSENLKYPEWFYRHEAENGENWRVFDRIATELCGYENHWSADKKLDSQLEVIRKVYTAISDVFKYKQEDSELETLVWASFQRFGLIDELVDGTENPDKVIEEVIELVNRGPKEFKTLRFRKRLQKFREVKLLQSILGYLVTNEIWDSEVLKENTLVKLSNDYRNLTILEDKEIVGKLDGKRVKLTREVTEPFKLIRLCDLNLKQDFLKEVVGESEELTATFFMYEVKDLIQVFPLVKKDGAVLSTVIGLGLCCVVVQGDASKIREEDLTALQLIGDVVYGHGRDLWLEGASKLYLFETKQELNSF